MIWSVTVLPATELDSRGRRLRAALAAVLVRDNAPELRLIPEWLNTWPSLGIIIAGMTHQGWDVQLTAYAARDCRANFFRVGIAHSIVGGTAWEPTPWRAVQRAGVGDADQGDQAMKQLALRASLVVMMLLTTGGTASAECGWVLWKSPTGKFFKQGRPGELPYEEGPLEFRNLIPRLERAFPTYKECMAQPEHQPLVGDMHRVTRMGHERAEVLVEVTFTCLPDTIDPRAPKGK